MSYLNNQVGYRDELLQTRSVIKKENWVLLEPDGLVKNAIPGYVNCDVTILGSPAMGASFADYLVTAHAGGKKDGSRRRRDRDFPLCSRGVRSPLRMRTKMRFLFRADTSILRRISRYPSRIRVSGREALSVQTQI